jgi:tetratricopeptide (TPR) repeat protein
VDVVAGAPEADALTAEALALGQDLAVDDATLAQLFTTSGICHIQAGRRPQAAASLREAARLAEQVGDTIRLGRALLNLADAVTCTDPAAGAEAARAAAAHLRRAGARDHLAVAVMNLAQALLMTGDWDTAEAELAQAADGDGLGDIEFLVCYRAWVAALRGDVPAAQATIAGLAGLRASEDPQDQANVAVAEAFTGAARRQPATALRCARAALHQVGVLPISHELLRWAWPLAARAAHDLADAATEADLLALLDGYRLGQLARCSVPNAIWPAPASLAPTVARTPPRRSLPRSPGCVGYPPPTTSLTACSTTPNTSPGSATPTLPKPPSLRPATSRGACAASHCWTAPQTWCPHDHPRRPSSHGLPRTRKHPQPQPRSLRPHALDRRRGVHNDLSVRRRWPYRSDGKSTIAAARRAVIKSSSHGRQSRPRRRRERRGRIFMHRQGLGVNFRFCRCGRHEARRMLPGLACRPGWSC